MARFNVGDKVAVISFSYDNKDPVWWSAPYNNSLEPYSSMELIELTITEAHNVPWEHDPDGEKEYEGYGAIDDKGRRWYNQYPTASYGQTSTEDDHIFYHESEKDLLAAKRVKQFVKDIYRGVNDLLSRGCEDTFFLISLWTKLYTDVKEKFEETFPGKTFIINSREIADKFRYPVGEIIDIGSEKEDLFLKEWLEKDWIEEQVQAIRNGASMKIRAKHFNGFIGIRSCDQITMPNHYQFGYWVFDPDLFVDENASEAEKNAFENGFKLRHYVAFEENEFKEMIEEAIRCSYAESNVI
ncbi:MAG: hypothetical protein M0R77_00085 [Gammaproteobacteria bacterium]|nr:hypothetical protein [Acholeplasmataceae bacterium]MCK9528952.1 hypothetical protein [Gammaproteobacteria bacterium]